jgi:hypothetical protein
MPQPNSVPDPSTLLVGSSTLLVLGQHNRLAPPRRSAAPASHQLVLAVEQLVQVRGQHVLLLVSTM